jgi:hypothetical protein
VRPEMSAQEQTDVGEELEVALAAEIAAGWRFTRMRPASASAPISLGLTRP